MTQPKIYLLTNEDDIETLTDKLERAFGTGVVSLLQIRRNSTFQAFDLITLYQETEILISLASKYDIPVIVNDNLELAIHFNTGLHLAKKGCVRTARRLLGDDVMIGRSCYDDLALFKESKKSGADYGSMGTLFHSVTRPLARAFDMEKLRQAGKMDLPVCAVGGITLNNIDLIRQSLNGSRLDYIAITNDIMNQPSEMVEVRCRAWRRYLEEW